MTITAAADGSALGNPGPAGWAWYIDENTWRAGGWPHGTNNMGELKAVLDLLESTAANPATAEEELLILCDSQYVINSVTKWMPGWKRKGWKKRDGKPVLNVELMQAIDTAMQGRHVHFEWVKGHTGHPMNEAADRRANAAATAFQLGRTPEEGPGLGTGVFSQTTDDGETTGTADASDTTGPAATGSDRATTTLADPASGPADTTPGAEVIACEMALLSEAVRSDPSLAAQLLHPDMTDIDPSGRPRHRGEVLDALSPLVGFDAIDELRPTDFTTSQLHPDVFLVTYATEGAQGTVRRTSLWLHQGEQWTLRHHQATPVLD